jgi:transcriptional antiterminator RfaH
MNIVLSKPPVGSGTQPLLYDKERWHVVRTQPHREVFAMSQLVNQGYRSFLPRHLKNRRHARKFDTVMAPLFPRYLFVILDLTRDRWRSINGTLGVDHLLTRAGQPEAVPHGVVEQLMAAADRDSVIHFSRLLGAGQTVRVTAGPFADHLGQLEQLDDSGRVRVLLDIMGGRIPVSLSETSVAPIQV